MAKTTIITVEKQNVIKSNIMIVGGGPAGMITALELSKNGFKPLLVGPETDPKDMRTTALMMPQIDVLKQLGVWDSIKKDAAALSTMRIIDGTNRLIRSPTVSFYASEISEKAFGYNMPNIALNNALDHAVAADKNITRIHASVTSYEHSENSVHATLSDGLKVTTKLLVAGDGRSSAAREAAGIGTRQWKYPQTAVILSFSHPLSHQNISTEFHTEEGPCVQVPLIGNNSSLVWVVNPNHANYLLSLGPTALADEIEKRLGSLLGKVTVTTPVQAWPLGGIVPKKFAANRTVLIGEAAHVFPPIGAQGLNLGVRDAVALVKAAKKDREDPGSKAVIDAYNRDRFPDVWVRTGSVHALNRALLSNLLPAQIIRSIGMETLRRVPPLRSLFMREGMHPGDGLRNIAACLTPPFLKKREEKHI